MRIKQWDRQRLISCAMGEIPADLRIENVQVFNVFTGEIYPAAVDVLDGIIVYVHPAGEKPANEAKAYYDGRGGYLLPGYIDTHMHVESTMMTPRNFGNAAIACGTTTVVVDPHEIANVMGIDGVRYMVADAVHSPLRQLNLAPSCVPAVPGLEESGASFTKEDIAHMLSMPGIYGIAEVMDFIGVQQRDPRMMGILAEGLRKDVLIQGHAPRIWGKELAAYILGGPVDNHDVRTGAECLSNLRQGMRINVKTSSLTKEGVDDMVAGIRQTRYQDMVSLCTDDVHAKDLLETGHINRVVRALITEGVDPRDAIRWGTYNGARDIGVEDIGAIGPGYVADLQLVGEMAGQNPFAVFVEGKLVYQDGVLMERGGNPSWDFPNTVHLPLLSAASFGLRAPHNAGDQVRCAIVPCGPGGRPGKEPAYEMLPVAHGQVVIQDDPNLCFLTVINRHGKDNQATAVYRNLGLIEGALAATMGHDSHNLTIAYKNPKDALVAADYLKAQGGGICTVLDGKILYGLPLPVAGLMSHLPAEELVKELTKLETSVGQICTSPSLMMRITILSLTASPDLRLSDLGLVDGRRQAFVPLFPDTVE
ncbi:amidohydrolase family protein [Eubacteriales bacterium OttesenSCG-928-M02]|nr:amidohydrolase family protein [Eubacteriales bacterium OttesenSCG-928-M02]